VNNGFLSGGMIDVEPPVACVGSTIRFTLSGVSDTEGGLKRVCCDDVPISPVQPSYTWVITKPDDSNVYGTGDVATVVADLPGAYACTFFATANRECPPPPITIGPETADAVNVDLVFHDMAESQEENPGGFLCVNDDDDNGNGIPDKNDPGATPGEDCLRVLTVSVTDAPSGTITLSVQSGASRIRFYGASDRSLPVTPPLVWTTPLKGPLPPTVYVEGIAPSDWLRDVTVRARFDAGSIHCDDEVNLTVIDAEMDPITSGVDPRPLNPAVVAPVDALLDNGLMFTDGNLFRLTTVAPNVDLTLLPVEWEFELTEGSITSQHEVIPDNDGRGAQLRIPTATLSNFGAGKMQFKLDGCNDCAEVRTLVRNVIPDLEPKDFRFKVKAHLCTDGAGTSTSRTASEVRTVMSDVTKVLSQCGVIVTTSQIVTEVVPLDYVQDLSSTFEKSLLFTWYNEDEVDIDVFFVQKIDDGDLTGVTLAPNVSGTLYEAGIAIADVSDDGLLAGQTAVRVLAHELTHYLQNYWFDSGHRTSPQNLMLEYASESMRDLDETQCLDMRANAGVD
jgi:hypothetical protein